MNAHIQEFLDYLTAERGSSDNTVSAYRNDLTQFDEFMVGRNKSDWADVTRDDLIEYILWLKEREYASATVARKVAAMKSFFGFLLRTGKIEDNPAEELDSPKVKKQLPQTLTPEEVDKLLALPAKAGNTPKALRDTALLEMLYATGMRVSETASVTLDDLDLQAGTVRCLGKGSKERMMPLYTEASNAVQAYLDKGRSRLLGANKAERTLFLNPRGERLTRQGLVADHQRLCQAARPGGSGDAAYAAPFLRHAHAERRRRSARGATTSGACEYFDHPGVYTYLAGTAAPSV